MIFTKQKTVDWPAVANAHAVFERLCASNSRHPRCTALANAFASLSATEKQMFDRLCFSTYGLWSLDLAVFTSKSKNPPLGHLLRCRIGKAVQNIVKNNF